MSRCDRDFLRINEETMGRKIRQNANKRDKWAGGVIAFLNLNGCTHSRMTRGRNGKRRWEIAPEQRRVATRSFSWNTNYTATMWENSERGGPRSRVPNAKITPSHLIGTVSLVNLVYCAAGIRYSVEAKPRQPPRLGLSIEAAAPDSFERLDFAAWNSRRETYFLR